MSTSLILAIVTHTPPWVWLLLAALLAVGVAQTVPRQLPVRRIVVMPLVLLALSLTGVATAFHGSALAAALLAWAAGVAAALALGGFKPLAVRGARWLPERGRLQVPGSWLPLALILSLFTLKYGVGVGLAMHPQGSGNAGLAAATGLAYGAFSGLFLARARSLRARLPAAAMRRAATPAA